MLFAILFIAAFLIGVVLYLLWRQWIIAVAVPMVLFALNVIFDAPDRGSLVFTLVFGLIIVFFASLLGAYVVQKRTIEPAASDSTHDA